ncbi:MFS transporter [Nocardioides zeae]|uniref:MFS transporter n=1 Tax=Nocardioides imazamoxiresistens TaxID=3231893 RepID=A0ABU3PQX9_9ACTN|nr:MFS transporter [Nocardioides zeae]MDT9591629.1 MFS transporter [Nocardioides zeae]
MTTAPTRTRERSDTGLVACLAFAALTGAIVAGLGSPIVFEVAQDRDVAIPDAQWSLIVTLIVGVVGTPVLSRLADGRLRRNLLVVALLLVAGGSALALVPTFPALLAARCFQGFGYAMVPLTVSIAREQLSGPVLARTLGVLSTSVAVGVGLGNPAIGLCVMVGGYRAAFVLALVVAGSAAWWVWRRVPVSGEGVGEVRIDLPGALLLGSALTATLLFVARGDIWGWTSAPVLALAGVGGLLLAAWVVVELRTREPLVDLRLTCARGVLGVNVAAFLLGIGVFGGATVVILVVQRPVETGVGLGQSVFVTGLLMLPMAVASLVSPPWARAAERVVGSRSVLAFGSLLVSAAFGFFVLWHDTWWHVAVMMLLFGIGIGFAYSVMPAIIVARTPENRTASATGINQVLRLMGGAVGAAIVAAVLSTYTPVGAVHPHEVGYEVAASFSCGGALLAAVISRLLLPRRYEPAADRDGGVAEAPDAPIV